MTVYRLRQPNPLYREIWWAGFVVHCSRLLYWLIFWMLATLVAERADWRMGSIFFFWHWDFITLVSGPSCVDPIMSYKKLYGIFKIIWYWLETFDSMSDGLSFTLVNVKFMYFYDLQHFSQECSFLEKRPVDIWC